MNAFIVLGVRRSRDLNRSDLDFCSMKFMVRVISQLLHNMLMHN